MFDLPQDPQQNPEAFLVVADWHEENGRQDIALACRAVARLAKAMCSSRGDHDPRPITPQGDKPCLKLR